LLWVMVTMEAVKATSHLASQSSLMDSSSWVAKWGTTCPCQAASGRPGRFRSASCMECRTVLDGVWIATGLVVGHLLPTGVVVLKKCAMQPELAMA